MWMRPQNKTALMTGATSNIGRAIVIHSRPRRTLLWSAPAVGGAAVRLTRAGAV
jgi:hypothetical protein